MLGAANVFVISIGMAVLTREPSVFGLVMVFGGIPGLVAGAVLGFVADVTRWSAPPKRIASLGVPAIGVVFGLAYAFMLPDLAWVSCIPTIVSVLLLERWTRVVVEPPVPMARIA